MGCSRTNFHAIWFFPSSDLFLCQITSTKYAQIEKKRPLKKKVWSVHACLKRIHETRRVRVRPTSLVKHLWRVEKRLSHWWRVADECDVKKVAHGRLPGSTSKLHATASGRVEVVVVCISFVYVLWVHCDFDLMIFLEREVKEQEDGVVVGVGCPLAEQLLPLISTEKVHAVVKSTLYKVQIPRCRKGQSPTTLSKSDAVKKKKSKFGGNLTRSGVRVRGLGLVWTSALTRSDRDQHQTRSRTRHRNLTRLVSHVLLTSLVIYCRWWQDLL